MSDATESSTSKAGRSPAFSIAACTSSRESPTRRRRLGMLRWKPPQPVVPWSGVRDASTLRRRMPADAVSGGVHLHPAVAAAERGLPLPQRVDDGAEQATKLPVLVWIHGGALTYGSSISDVRDGVPLAQKGIVLVSLNYRLGPLGLSRASGADGGIAAGIVGQLRRARSDRRAAVGADETSSAFGGDPAKVTIAGESAGSWSVNTLVASPLAAGLFRPRDRPERRPLQPHAASDRGSWIAGLRGKCRPGVGAKAWRRFACRAARTARRHRS